MKYLAVVLILCVGFKVNAAPALGVDNDDAITMTFIPPVTSDNPITINPASGETVTAASMPPASAQTETAPTIQTMTTEASQTSMPTTAPSEMTTDNNMTTSNETMTTMTMMTTEGTTSGMTTGSTKTTMSTMPSVHTTKTTLAPQPPTPKPKHGFDGGSFAGGIALGLVLAAIILIAYRCYIMRHKAKGYGDVN